MPDRPIKPTEDPKDMIPIDLYRQDPNFNNIFRQYFPPGFIAMIENVATQEAQTFATLQTQRLFAQVPALMTELKGIEAQHREAIKEIVRKMVADFYGDEIAEHMNLKLSEGIPPRPTDHPYHMTDYFKFDSSVHREHDRINEQSPMDERRFQDIIFRRELYNLAAQAHGWDGMSAFFNLYGPELDQVSPGLAQKYRDLHNAFRYGQYTGLRLIGPVIPETALFNPHSQLRNQHDGITYGREIVQVEMSKGTDEAGDPYIQIDEVNGVASGFNGWALAHEAMKAGFQMATALEATRRAGLTDLERYRLDFATNSPAAEIRQGIYGPTFDRHLRKTLAILKYPQKKVQLESKIYLRAVENLFILNHAAFSDFVQTISRADFFENVAQQNRLRTMLQEQGVFDEGGGGR